MATRRERVILELQDDFTSGIIRAAAATKLADKELDHLGGTQARGARQTDTLTQSFTRNARSLEDLESRARRAERSGSPLLDTFLALGPALVPIGAVGVPALAGLATQAGFAAAGLGTALVAVNGIGDGLKAVDAYQLDPTAANLEKMNTELAKLGPSGREFVAELDRLEPILKGLRDTAQDGFLPGVADGIDSLLSRLPEVRSLISTISQTEGDLTAQAGAALGGRDFDEFFTYLQTNAKPILSDLGRSLGNVTEGLSHLFVGFAPEERAFSSLMLEASRDFNAWADGLDRTQGFQDFIAYVRKEGPVAGKALASIGGAVLSVVEAAAPLSGPVLKGLTALAQIVDKIADSDLGTPLFGLAAGLALVNRALAVGATAKNSLLTELLFGAPGKDGGARGLNGLERTRVSVRGLTSDIKTANSLPAIRRSFGLPTAAEMEAQAAAAGRLRTRAGLLAKGAAGLGALAIAGTGAADGIGLTNTASLALAGTMIGPWGAAVGAGAGLLLDVTSAGKSTVKVFQDLDRAAKGGDIQNLASSLTAAKKELADVNNVTGFGDFFSDALKIDGGLLQGKNVLTDGQDSIDKAQAKYDKLRSTYLGIAETMGRPLPPGAGPEQIAAFANEIGPALAAAGISVDKLGKGSFAGIERAADAIKRYEQNTATIPAATAIANNMLMSTRLEANQLSSALDAVFSPKLNRAQANDAFIRSLQQLRTELKANAGLSGNSSGALDNRAAVNSTVSALNAKLKADADAGASSDELVRKLQKGRRAILDQGEAAGISRRQMRTYLDTLGLTPDLVKTLIQINGVTEAQRAILRVSDQLAALPSDKFVGIHIVRTGADIAGIVGDTPKKKADGGRISGPGGPRDDVIPALLSNGEYVINAEAVGRYGPSLFDDLNSMRLARGGLIVPGYDRPSPLMLAAGGRMHMPDLGLPTEQDLAA